MLDLLIITPYAADGRDIDGVGRAISDFHEHGMLPLRAKVRHARGIYQALDIMDREKFRAIIVSNYFGLHRDTSGGITEVWDKVESQRLFDRARVLFMDILEPGFGRSYR